SLSCSSRRRHTRFSRDWSSDVCSSDLYHQFLYDELEAAQLEVGEVSRLEAEQQQLEHAEEIKRALLGAADALQDGEVNSIALLKVALQQLQQAARHMPALSPQAKRLESSFIELKDLAEE